MEDPTIKLTKYKAMPRRPSQNKHDEQARDGEEGADEQGEGLSLTCLHVLPIGKRGWLPARPRHNNREERAQDGGERENE